jgi:hypothetical protein
LLLLYLFVGSRLAAGDNKIKPEFADWIQINAAELQGPWKGKKLPLMPSQDAAIAAGRWQGSYDMPNGDWATRFTAIGLNCGYSRGGNPVKVERLGTFDIQGIQKQRDYNRRLNAFYLGLVDFLQRRLDALSVEHGRLQQTYEIFDLEGLTWGVCSFTTISFIKEVLLAFATHYPSSFCKCCVINAPAFLPPIWRMVCVVLPESVKAKCKIFGADWEQELREDLTPEAYAWVVAPPAELIHAPLRREPVE